MTEDSSAEEASLDASLTASDEVSTGVSVQETEDGMVITGGGKVHGAVFETYHDHRMAMSMAVLALAAEGESEILNPEVVDISCPNFYDLL